MLSHIYLPCMHMALVRKLWMWFRLDKHNYYIWPNDYLSFPVPSCSPFIVELLKRSYNDIQQSLADIPASIAFKLFAKRFIVHQTLNDVTAQDTSNGIKAHKLTQECFQSIKLHPSPQKRLSTLLNILDEVQPVVAKRIREVSAAWPLSLSLSHTHTHTHTHSLSLSLLVFLHLYILCADVIVCHSPSSSQCLATHSLPPLEDAESSGTECTCTCMTSDLLHSDILP